MAGKRNGAAKNAAQSNLLKRFEEKPQKEMPNFFLCTRCGKEVTDIKEFVASQSELYAGFNHKLPICKHCMDDIFNHYLDKYTGVYEQPEKEALRRICQLYDIYYDDDIYEKAVAKINSSVTLVMAYIRITNLRQYQGKTFDTTLDYELKKANENIIKDANSQEVLDSETISERTIRFFGAGLGDVEDYEFLQEEYNDWITRHECNTKAQEEVFKRIVIKQLEIRKVARAGGDTKELDNSFIKYLETAKLQPKQNAAETMAASQTFGTLIDKFENTRPLPEIDEELRDVDRIGLYLDVFFRGHLAKLMNLKNAFSTLYTKFIKKFTVTKPEYDEDEDSEALFDAIFGNADLSETVDDITDEENFDFDFNE